MGLLEPGTGYWILDTGYWLLAKDRFILTLYDQRVILSDISIRAALELGRIEIDPFDPGMVQPMLGGPSSKVPRTS